RSRRFRRGSRRWCRWPYNPSRGPPFATPSCTEPALFQILHVFEDRAILTDEDNAYEVGDDKRRNDDFLTFDVRLEGFDAIGDVRIIPDDLGHSRSRC